MTVYHRNLTSLVGYCYEGSNMALIYEFMENGDLRDYLSGKKADALSWKTRLQIAIDAAQGLEYMHNGCVPPIIHRDVKPENILLTKNFRAKLGDFGLSRFFSNDGVSHVLVSCCAGTIGYLAPEAVDTDCLDQKSDVYSFGVVLLQIVTGQPTSNGNKHLKDWVRSIYTNGYGDVTSIIDQRLQGDFDINTIKDAVDIAIQCVSETLTDRPDMSKVVATLKNCLAAELAPRNYNSVSESTNSSKVFYENSTTEVIPLAKQS
ncbi:Serine/threonine protein kinase [Trema orientale]|uniref:Serine/threonine protein kinase n=1 Tax=Trema orientale TaxID=63057 RepID=A0A2P5BQG1_TREOI|nr:Serine/threonine protein kinase [Trema orientale]